MRAASMDELDFGIRRPADFVPVPDAILETTIVPRFEAIVRQQRDRIAIQSGGRALSFQELDNAVNELAWRIIESTGDDESPVAFLFDDELLSIVALLAILKSGRAYTSLHAANSEEQLRTFLEDSTARLLITGGSAGERARRLIADSPRVRALRYDEIETTAGRGSPGRLLTPDTLFSISYTGGSTGRPKGILERHRRRAQNAQFRNNLGRISPSDRVVLFTSVSHRAAYPSLMAMVVSGATLCLLDLKTITAQQTLNWLQEEQITVYRSTPSIFRAIFGLAPDHLVLPGIRFVALGGEPVTSADVERFKMHTAEDCVLLNSFASSEAGTIALQPVYHQTPPFKGLLAAGRPPPGTEVFLVDEQRKIVGEGMVGEIAVRGKYLSDGYWQRPDLTAEKFTIDAANPDLRTFYTSDYGRWLPDGTLEVLGRKDRQVKIRGFRVQLEAVELAIRNQPGVEDAAVIESSSRAGQKRLVAYVCMRQGNHLSTHRMRKDLASHLPSYAVPSAIVQVDALPRSSTGKISSADLPPPAAPRPDLEGEYVAPRTPMELEIASIWARVLELDEVGVEDDFFALGGDSLSVLEMTLAVEKALAKAVPAEFLRHPTIGNLSALLTGPESHSGDTESPNWRRRERTPARRYSGWRTKLTARKLCRLADPSFPGEKLDWLIDLALTPHIVRMPYEQARQWALSWSRNLNVRRMLYGRRLALFERWLACLDDCHADPSEAFGVHLLANVLYTLPGEARRKASGAGHTVDAYRRTPFAFWRTLGDALSEVPAGRPSEHFPVHGFEHLSRARERGRGVILVSFHGFPVAGGMIPLKRLLEIEELPTISFLVPRRGTRYHDRRDEIPAQEAARLNARIALFGQEALRAGKIVNFASDWSDTGGRQYQRTVAGRQFAIKAGFAELAVNTGAAVIPYVRRCLDDGRIELDIGSPFQDSGGERSLRIEHMLDQYAGFVGSSYAIHPESMRWYDILTHLRKQVGAA